MDDEEHLVQLLYKKSLQSTKNNQVWYNKKIKEVEGKIRNLNHQIRKTIDEKERLLSTLYNSLLDEYSLQYTQYELDLIELNRKSVHSLSHYDRITQFISLIKSVNPGYILNGKLLPQLIEKLIVSEKVVVDGIKSQSVEIYLKL